RQRAGAVALGLVVLIVVLIVVASSGGHSGRNHPALSPNVSASASTGGTRHVRGAHTGRGSTVAVPSTGTEVLHARGLSVPILMYHVIAPPPAGAPYPGLYVPPAEFAGQMHALADDGWHAITLDQLDAYWKRDAPLPKGKPIVITFDNGYLSQYTQALPVLQRLGWDAVENLQLTGLPPSEGGLSERQVRALVSAGWELDTQGFSHADLTNLTASELNYQVAVARTVIQRRYHVPANWFCYPSGQYDASVVAAVRAAGYLGSTTVVPGWAGPAQDPYRLERLRVLGGTSPQGLLSLIDGTRANGQPPSSYVTS
ncbi:MAG TPA: polysaccharide deacetylase family protein, partial [Solirubrobacteraceae bacterium]|nr:polysaccharide deacetylase family protein [Solirubrobacteraceae bacterium]